MKLLVIFGVLLTLAFCDPTMYKKNENNFYEPGEISIIQFFFGGDCHLFMEVSCPY
jgi:hypothetical protein